MQEPATARLAVEKHPEPRARRIARDVVIASDIATVPPAAFDALRSLLELERAFEVRLVVAVERLRRGEEPQRSPLCLVDAGLADPLADLRVVFRQSDFR